MSEPHVLIIDGDGESAAGVARSRSSGRGRGERRHFTCSAVEPEVLKCC